MDALINALRGVSYDVVGILLPGVMLALMLAILDAVSGGFVLASLLQAAVLETSWFPLMSIAGLASYVAGVLLKQLGDFWLFRCLFKKLIPLKECSLSSELQRSASRRLKQRLSIEGELSAGDFSKAAKAYVSQSPVGAFVINYQNRYELHRSTAISAFLVAALSCVVAVFCEHPFWLYAYSLTLVFVGGILVMSFRKYWTLYGDYLVVCVLVSSSLEAEA